MKTLGFCLFLSLLFLPVVINAADFHVATNGHDSNPGTLQAPFLTIGKAKSVMQSGDRCLIHDGIYRETIAPKTDKLYFGAYQNAHVEINGCDIVSGAWKEEKEKIFKTPMPEKVWQLFMEGKQMNLARFPDAGDNSNPYSKNLFTNDKARWAPTEILMPGDADENIVKFEDSEDRPENNQGDQPENLWVGGVYSGMHGRNPFTTCTGTISASKRKILKVQSYA